MMFLSLTIVSGYSQGRKVPLDKGFIENTIEYYYSTQAQKNPGSVVFLIQKDSLTSAVKTNYGNFSIRLVSPEELSSMPQVAGENAKVDRLMIRWITFDTIDVVITGCTVAERKIKKKGNGNKVSERFLTNCTDSFVDVPTCRFVYDRSKTQWAQLNRGKYTKN